MKDEKLVLYDYVIYGTHTYKFLFNHPLQVSRPINSFLIQHITSELIHKANFPSSMLPIILLATP